MIIFLYIVWTLLVLSLVFYITFYFSHREMVKFFCDVYGPATFNKFLEEFNAVEWEERDQIDPYSFSDRNSNSKIGDGIISFNGKGMILGFTEYWKYLLFINQHKLQKSDGNQKDLWK